MRYVIVTGMSGAGKSAAASTLEDMGFYCIDNMPVALIPRFAELYSQTDEKRSDVAFIIDVRGETEFEPLIKEISALKASGYDCKVLVLDCSDNVLINRYKETRRIHPLSTLCNLTVSEALREERERLSSIFEVADYKIDTTYQSVQQLKEQIQKIFSPETGRAMTINVLSFGFKYGSVAEADIVFDVRCFPNPFWVPELKPLTGLDAPVREYVMEKPQTVIFLEKLYDIIEYLIPLYAAEGKKQLTVAIGCTGGKHRSVAIAEALSTNLRERGENVSVTHRDIKIKSI